MRIGPYSRKATACANEIGENGLESVLDSDDLVDGLQAYFYQALKEEKDPTKVIQELVNSVDLDDLLERVDQDKDRLLDLAKQEVNSAQIHPRVRYVCTRCIQRHSAAFGCHVRYLWPSSVCPPPC